MEGNEIDVAAVDVLSLMDLITARSAEAEIAEAPDNTPFTALQ